MRNPISYYADFFTGLWERWNPQPDKITKYEVGVLKDRGATGWRIADLAQDAGVVGMVAEIYGKAGAKPPKIILYDSPKDNAMHLQNDTLCISTAKLAQHDPVELRATIAHEYAHQAQRNLTLSVILTRLAAVMATATWVTNKAKPALEKTGAFFSLVLFGTFTKVALVAHLVTELPWKAYRRWQERDADAMSVRLTGSAEGMIRNLEHHAAGRKETPEPEPKGLDRVWKDLTRTHDSHEERIAHLKQEEAKRGQHLA